MIIIIINTITSKYKINTTNMNQLLVTENQTATILWDMPIQTDKANRPDSGERLRKEPVCLSICLSSQKGTPL